MKELFMDFSSVTAERDSAFTELTTSNVNLTTQLRHQEDQIWSLQSDMCNIKVSAAAKTTKIGRDSNTGGNYNTHTHKIYDHNDQLT